MTKIVRPKTADLWLLHAQGHLVAVHDATNIACLTAFPSSILPFFLSSFFKI